MPYEDISFHLPTYPHKMTYIKKPIFILKIEKEYINDSYEMLQKSTRETHFEAATTRFEENPRTQQIPEEKTQIPNLAPSPISPARKKPRIPTWPLPSSGYPPSWATPTGEFALSEFQNVFADVCISSERMKLLQKSTRETYFEAATTRLEENPRTQQILEEKSQKPNN